MTEVMRYSRAEVATRNGKNNQPIWIIIRDVVYDVTDYVMEHPGGVESIMDSAGKDSTKDYDWANHSSDANTMLAKYRIGQIVEDEKYYDENGKKKKRVKSSNPDDGQRRSCMSVVTCGLIG